MNQNAIEARGKSLEEAFFSKQNQDLINKLHAKKAAEESKDNLRASTGIKNDSVLDNLVSSGVSVSTMTALTMVPLVTVAWADGQMEEKERKAVIKAAHEQGITDGSDASLLLDQWLSTKPNNMLFKTWKDYVSALKEIMPAAAFEALKGQVVSCANSVADSAGGILGIASISNVEKQAISSIEAAFS